MKRNGTLQARARLVAAGAMAALTIGVAVAPTAQANPNDDNYFSDEACKDPDRSGFKFHVFFNSWYEGSYRNIGYAVYDFDAIPLPADVEPMRYCSIGASSPWPGSGQKMKNNAASARNSHASYNAYLYYNSGYKGATDRIPTLGGTSRLGNTYNNNASFKWVG